MERISFRSSYVWHMIMTDCGVSSPHSSKTTMDLMLLCRKRYTRWSQVSALPMVSCDCSYLRKPYSLTRSRNSWTVRISVSLSCVENPPEGNHPLRYGKCQTTLFAKYSSLQTSSVEKHSRLLSSMISLMAQATCSGMRNSIS